MTNETSEFDPSRQIRVLVLEPGEPDAAIVANFQFVTLEASDVPPPANDQNIQWDAISYSWEGQEPSVYMKIGEEEVGSTLIVQELLRDLRSQSEKRILWIDALCIKQDDNEEKSMQIPMMCSIYERAQSVIVWLRPESVDAAKTVVEAAIWADGVDITSLTRTWQILLEEFRPQACPEALRELFRCVLESMWFQRIWVIQEAIVNRNLLVQLAGRTLPWEVFSSAIIRFMSRLPARRAMEEDLSECFERGQKWSLTRLGSEPFLPGHSMVKLIIDLRHWLHNSNMPIAPSQLILLCRDRRATLPVDMIYAICGIFGFKNSPTQEKKAFPVDYNISPQELYESFTLWCIEREGNLDVLAHQRYSRLPKVDGVDYNKRRLAGLPTWASDWSSAFNDNCSIALTEAAPFTGTVPQPLTPAYAPIYRLELAGRALVLRGFVLDTIVGRTRGPSPFANIRSPFWRDGALACRAMVGQGTGLNAFHATKSGRVAYTFRWSLDDPPAKVCVLYGGRSLFVLDPLPDDTPEGAPLLHRLQCGHCFIDGFEDGKGIEFARERGLEEEDFYII